MPTGALMRLPRLLHAELALLDQPLQLLHQHLHGLVVQLREQEAALLKLWMLYAPEA